MGTNILDELNTYIASLEVDLSKATVLIRHVLQRLLGAHNLWNYKISISDRTVGRDDYSGKDSVGDEIVKRKFTVFTQITFKYICLVIFRCSSSTYGRNARCHKANGN